MSKSVLVIASIICLSLLWAGMPITVLHADAPPQAGQETYPLLCSLVKILDREQISMVNGKSFCIDQSLQLDNKPNAEIIISAAEDQNKLMVLSVTRSNNATFSFENIGFYAGTSDALKKYPTNDAFRNAALFWYTDMAGIVGIAQYASNGNGKIMFSTIRLHDGLAMDVKNVGSSYPRPLFERIDEEAVTVSSSGKEIYRIPIDQNDKNLEFTRSPWLLDETNGGFCYALCSDTSPTDDLPNGPNKIIVNAYVAHADNGKLAISPAGKLETTDLDSLIGGGVGVPITGIRRLAQPTGNFSKNIVYLSIAYQYAQQDEIICVYGIIRIMPGKKPAFVDYQITYRNMANRILNFNWSRDIDGEFKLYNTSNEPVLYRDQSEIAESEMLCTVNGGRIWLLDLR